MTSEDIGGRSRSIRPGRVVVGVDGSSSALAAVTWAAAEPARRDAELQLVEVPGPSLVSHAAGAALLVVGSNGPGGPIPLSVGRVLGEVTSRAGCPAVVVPGRRAGSSSTSGAVLVAVDGDAESEGALAFAAGPGASVGRAAHRPRRARHRGPSRRRSRTRARRSGSVGLPRQVPGTDDQIGDGTIGRCGDALRGQHPTGRSRNASPKRPRQRGSRLERTPPAALLPLPVSGRLPSRVAWSGRAHPAARAHERGTRYPWSA